MTLDDTEFITGSETGSVSHTPSGNTETAFDVNSEHTLKLISTDSEHPFTPGESCTQTFKVVEKELDPVGLTCNISIANPSVSSTRTIDKAQVTATNCESGCTYTENKKNYKNNFFHVLSTPIHSKDIISLNYLSSSAIIWTINEAIFSSVPFFGFNSLVL